MRSSKKQPECVDINDLLRAVSSTEQETFNAAMEALYGPQINLERGESTTGPREVAPVGSTGQRRATAMRAKIRPTSPQLPSERTLPVYPASTNSTLVPRSVPRVDDQPVQRIAESTVMTKSIGTTDLALRPDTSHVARHAERLSRSAQRAGIGAKPREYPNRTVTWHWSANQKRRQRPA